MRSMTAYQGGPLRFRLFWTVLGIGFVLLVIYLSLTPDPLNIGQPTGVKIDHAIAYAWLMIWFAQIHRALGRRLIFAVAFCTLGIALEYLQGMTDYRHFAYLDMLFDLAGVVIGLVLSQTPLQNTLRLIESLLKGKEGRI